LTFSRNNQIDKLNNNDEFDSFEYLKKEGLLII